MKNRPIHHSPPLSAFTCAGVLAALLTMTLSGCQQVSVADSDPDRVPRNRLQLAVQEYCHEDARETAQYLLTQGTPDDVDLMEQAVGMLDTGEWLVIADIVRPSQRSVDSKHAGSGDSAWKVDAACSWKTPFVELDGRYEFELEIVLGPDGSRRVFRLPTTNQ